MALTYWTLAWMNQPYDAPCWYCGFDGEKAPPGKPECAHHATERKERSG